MTKFIVGNYELTFSDKYQTYSEIKYMLNNIVKEETEKLSSQYDYWDNIETVASNYTRYSLNRILESFLKFKPLALQLGLYDFNEAMLTNHLSWRTCTITAPLNSAFIDVKNTLNSIDSQENSEKAAREYRKETRTRVVGGGFGISGAAKGMAIAGAANLATGAVHSTFNMIGNMFTSMAASSDRRSLYNSSKAYLIEGFKKSLQNLFPVICDILTHKSDCIDQKKAGAILKNLYEGNFDKSSAKKPLIEAFIAYPFDEDIYVSYLTLYPEDEYGVTQMADFFKVDISNFLNTNKSINGYNFHSLIDAINVRDYESKIFNEIKDVISEEYLRNIYDKDYLKYYGSQNLLDSMIYLYKENIPNHFVDNSDIQNYSHEMVEFFNSVPTDHFNSELLNICAPTEDLKQKLLLKLSIFKSFLLKKGINEPIFFGNDFLAQDESGIKKLKKNLKSYIGNNKYPDIYIAYINDQDEMLCYTSIGLITHKTITFDFSAENISFNKDLFGSTVKINDIKTSYVLGKNMNYLVKMIRCLLPEVRLCITKNLAEKYFDMLGSQKNIAFWAWGSTLYFGINGMPVDKQHGVQFICKAALYGNVLAQNKVGEFYYHGEHVEKDYETAKFWLELSSQQNDDSKNLLQNPEFLNINALDQDAAISKLKSDFNLDLDIDNSVTSLELSESENQEDKKGKDEATLTIKSCLVCILMFYAGYQLKENDWSITGWVLMIFSALAMLGLIFCPEDKSSTSKSQEDNNKR